MNFQQLCNLIQIKSNKYVTESFFHGFENSMGYSGKKWVEIFKNPTQRELQTIGNYNIGMILTTNDVFVWDRNNAYHKHILKELKNTNGIPILFDYEGKKAFCLITDASTITPYHHNPKTKQTILNNPWMKKFNDIEVDYYDSAIVGDWEKLN
jgi:hypothetical protein